MTMTNSVKKQVLDMRVDESLVIHPLYTLLKLTPAGGESLPEIIPGQFVEVAVPDAPHTFLRRPISVNFVERDSNRLWLLIRRAGEGTARLCDTPYGAVLNIMLPLGNGFTIPSDPQCKPLLVGGGVGVAPLLMLGKELQREGFEPAFLLGARSRADLLQIDLFEQYGKVYITTDDGSYGHHGFVTQHPLWEHCDYNMVYCCGPAPMMKGIARIASSLGIECEVSLENMMACGLGACLCCVENTVKGNVCVCTEGPVFNIKQLTWPI